MCRGSGNVDGKPRRGVSVFPRVEGLCHYMEAKAVDLEDCLIVELEGEPSGEVDFDADQGAMLVIPSAIIACRRVEVRKPTAFASPPLPPSAEREGGKPPNLRRPTWQAASRNSWPST